MPSSTRTIEPELVSIKELCILCGNRSRKWVYDQMRRDPSFPRPLKLSTFSNAWRLNEVRAYFDALPRHELTGLSGPERRALAASGAA
jgi:predicted DNA-binding transcriptional regulator AlpA